MKLPPRLASWWRARGRAHEEHFEEHERLMSEVDMPARFGRTVRVPPPPGGWPEGEKKSAADHEKKNHGRPLPPPQD